MGGETYPLSIALGTAEQVNFLEGNEGENYCMPLFPSNLSIFTGG